MQTQYFMNGGYVVHKAFVGNSKHSAWFDAAGNLTDAERIDTRNRSYRATDAAKQELQSMFGNRQK